MKEDDNSVLYQRYVFIVLNCKPRPRAPGKEIGLLSSAFNYIINYIIKRKHQISKMIVHVSAFKKVKRYHTKETFNYRTTFDYRM